MALAWAASLKSLIRYSVLGIISAAGVQRAISAYSGYGRNLFVLRVQLEA